MHEHKGMISIWFFIGVLLLAYGVLIFAAGVYDVFQPPAKPVVLSQLHAGVWWGLLLLAMGLFYSIRFRPRKAQGN
jgi:FtsH-binding integral membrane protein